MDRLAVDRSAWRIAVDIRGSKPLAFQVKNSFEKGWAVLLVCFWRNSSFLAQAEKRMELSLFIERWKLNGRPLMVSPVTPCSGWAEESLVVVVVLDGTCFLSAPVP